MWGTIEELFKMVFRFFTLKLKLNIFKRKRIFVFMRFVIVFELKDRKEGLREKGR